MAAIMAALQVFEAGLSRMVARHQPVGRAPVVAEPQDRADLIASIAGRAILLALDTAVGAARASAAGGGFAIAAAMIRDRAAQTAQMTDALERHIAGLRASPEDEARSPC